MTSNSEALVAPIRAERYAARDRLSDLIAPPYDVISPEARSRLQGRHAHNIVALILPDGGEGRYADAASRLDRWRSDGTLVRDAEPAVYVLQQEFSTPDGRRYTRTGLLAGIAAEPYDKGRVLPHERTHAGPKADRLSLIKATRSMFESIFLLAPDADGALRRSLADITSGPPAAQAELDGVRCSVWKVGGAAAASTAVSAGDRLYIADGHHRFETAVAYRRENPAAKRTVGLVVPLGDPGLVVLPTHRLVYGNQIDESAAVRALSSHFVVAPVESELDPDALLRDMGREITAALVAWPSGTVHSLRLRKDADLSSLGTGPAAALDVARVDAFIVSRLREMAGPTSRTGYTANTGELLASVGLKDCVAGVLLNPTRVEEVLAVADAGQVMPQKSTYFIPKVPSGLVILPLD